MKTFKEFISEMKYPTASKDVWYSDSDYEKTGGKLTHMSPDEYLSSVKKLDIDDSSRDNIDDLKSHIKSGRQLDPLKIYSSGKEDGRHRAHAARELGIKKVPVITWKKLNENIHDETGLPFNKDGTVTVYHHTNKEKADNIRKTGILQSAGEPHVYVTTHKDADTGYGDTPVAINVHPHKLELDDEFPNGRKDFRIDTGKPKGSVKVKIA